MYTERFLERQKLGLHKFDGSYRGLVFENERIVSEISDDGNEKKLFEYDIHEIEHVFSYEESVIKYIRERYSIDEEIAIQRQRDTKVDEFNEYFAYCEECKAKAKGE